MRERTYVTAAVRCCNRAAASPCITFRCTWNRKNLNWFEINSFGWNAAAERGCERLDRHGFGSVCGVRACAMSNEHANETEIFAAIKIAKLVYLGIDHSNLLPHGYDCDDWRTMDECTIVRVLHCLRCDIKWSSHPYTRADYSIQAARPCAMCRLSIDGSIDRSMDRLQWNPICRDSNGTHIEWYVDTCVVRIKAS